MADDCRPWLAKAIIKHDQKHGANFGAIATGELCQLVQFHTFRGKFDPHAQIFGEICDPTHWVRVRFNVDATDEFEAEAYVPSLALADGRAAHGLNPEESRLTFHLREMFRIKEYRIIPCEPSDRMKAPWYKPKTKESLSRTTSGTGYDSATSSAAGSSKTQLPMIILEILKWEIPCGNRDDPLYWGDQIKELGCGPKDGEVQKVLIKWWTGDSDKSQEVPVEDEEEAPTAGPSRSNAKARTKPKDKGKAKAIAPPPPPLAALPVTYARATIIDDLIAGKRHTLPDWLFDVSEDQREELDNIEFFGLDVMKDLNLSLGQPASGQAGPVAEVPGVGEGEAEEGAGSLPTPRQSVSPAPAVKAEPDTRARIGPFRVRQSNPRVTVSPIPSSPPPGQTAAVPPPAVVPPPAPASPDPSRASIEDEDEDEDGPPQNTLSLPTPGQRFRPTKSSGPTPSQAPLRSSIPEPTPGQGSPEPRGSNPESIRFTNTQNPLTLPPANQRQRRGEFQDGGGGSSQSSAGRKGSQEQSIRSVVIDPKFDKSGLAMKIEASSSIPSPAASKAVVGNHKMRKSRPSIEDFLVPEPDAKKKKKNYLASSPASSDDEAVDMENGQQEEEGAESDGREEESEDGLSEYEARQRKNRPSTSRGKTAKTPPSSQSKGDLDSSPPPMPVGVPKHAMRSESRGKGKGKARVSGSSQSQPSQSQPSQFSQPSQPSQSHSQTSQKHSQSQTQTQTPQISSAEEAQRITPGQFLRPAYPSMTGRLRSPTKSLSASQESVDMLAAYRPASNEEEEEEGRPDARLQGEDGEDGEEGSGGDEEDEEEEEEETVDTPPRDLPRPIIKKTGGAQLVVESAESGTASSGKGRGRVLVDDSEESAEKAQAQGSSGIQSTFEDWPDGVEVTAATISSTSKTGKKRARADEEKDVEEFRGNEKRAKISATKVEQGQGTQANDPQPKLSVFGQINRMIRRLTGSSQERGEEPPADAPAAGQEKEEEEEGEGEGDMEAEQDQAPARTLVASARSVVPPSATAGATLHARHSSASSSKAPRPGPVDERQATTSISQSSRTIPTQHFRQSSSSSRSAVPPTAATASRAVDPSPPPPAEVAKPRVRNATAISVPTLASAPAPAPRTSTSFLVPDLLIPAPASSLSSTRKQSSTKTGRRESVKRDSAEGPARQAPASATGTSTGPSRAAISGRRPPAPPRTFSIGPDGLPAPSRPVSRETPAVAVKQEQRGSSAAAASGGREVKREREDLIRDEKPAVARPKVERTVQKLRGFKPDLRVHDGLEEDWVVEKISEARLKRLAFKQEAGA